MLSPCPPRCFAAAIGKNSRSFAAVDELVFQDAKAKPVYKAVYKILVEMHEAFQQLDARSDPCFCCTAAASLGCGCRWPTGICDI